MGWNDRLPEDPYIPPDAFYRDRDDYEAWLEYVKICAEKETTGGLTSQTLDPQTLQTPTTQEPSLRRSILARIWAGIFGQNVSKNSQQKVAKRSRAENVDVPF